jgi:parallel beta-helix repeat protein
MGRRAIFPATLALTVFTLSISPAGDLDPLGPPASTPAPDPRTAVESLAGTATVEHIITQPGSYRLTRNLTVASGEHGIAILAENVSLDLEGFQIRGSGDDSGSAGILADQAAGLSVVNGNISNFERGVSLNFVFRGRLADLSVSECETGIEVDQAHSLRIERCDLRSTGVGVMLANVSLSRIDRCLITVCEERGIVLAASHDNTLESNTILSCQVHGVLFDGLSHQNLVLNNLIARNIFAGAIGMEFVAANNVALGNVARESPGGNYINVLQPIVNGASPSDTTGSWVNLSF